MKKFVELLLCGLMTFSVLTAAVGCGREDSPTHLVVSILNQDSEIEMFTKVKDAFCEKHQGYSVELLPLSTYEQDVISKLRAGESIDVLHVPDNYVTSFQTDGVLENLEPYIEKSALDRSLYFDSMMNMGKLYFSANEDQYMMPRDYSKFVVYYNKKIFDDCNVAYPETGWTWDDFKETCRLLNAKMNENYVCVDASFSYAILNYGIAASCGAENFLDENYNLVKDTAALENSLKMIRSDIVEPGYCVKPEVYQAGDFIKQAAAMSIDVRPRLASYKTAGIDFDVVEFPAIGDAPKVATGSSGFSIYAESKKKDLAWEFISFVVSEEGQKIMSRQGNVVPVLRSLAEAENAEWKTVTNGKNIAIHNEPFYSYNERDVVGSYWGDLPSEAITSYNAFWATCMSDYLNGKKDLSACIKNFGNSIVAYKRMYPEYFR